MRVLIIEDDEHIRDVLVTVLESFGHHPLPVKNLSEATSALTEFKPEIILLDLILEGGISTPFVDLVKKILSERTPRIIVLSAMAKADKVAESLGVEFLAKPFSLEDLQDALDGNKKAPNSEKLRA